MQWALGVLCQLPGNFPPLPVDLNTDFEEQFHIRDLQSRLRILDTPSPLPLSLPPSCSTALCLNFKAGVVGMDCEFPCVKNDSSEVS